VIHFSAKGINDAEKGLAEALRKGPYSRQALVPATPWLDHKPPAAPHVQSTVRESIIDITLAPGNGEEVFRWVAYAQYGTEWEYAIHGPDDRTIHIPRTREVETPRSGSVQTPAKRIDRLVRVAVSAVDRIGNESRRTMIETGK
jgi:hypothetical protein